MKVRLAWTGNNGRDGWWLLTDPPEIDRRPIAAVMGPSICASSGGGPTEALARAAAHYPEITVVAVDAPPTHSYFPTRAICQECAAAAARLTRALRGVPVD